MDKAKKTPRIYAALDNHQEYHQLVVVKVEGMIAKKFIFVLIDPRSTHSYITPKVVEIFSLRRMKHNNPWLGQLAIGKKGKVSEVAVQYPHRVEWTSHKSKFK